MYAYVHACHRVHVEVRGHFVEVSSLPPPSGSQDQTQVIRLVDKPLNPLRCFAGPVTPVVFCFVLRNVNVTVSRCSLKIGFLSHSARR